jgi:hypothetical protein
MGVTLPMGESAGKGTGDHLSNTDLPDGLDFGASKQNGGHLSIEPFGIPGGNLWGVAKSALWSKVQKRFCHFLSVLQFQC